jgi:hypothetical protein
VSKIGEGPNNPIIAPGAIFPGHANNQLLDVPVNSRSAGDTPRYRSIEFARNEPPVPRQDGVRLGGRRHFTECSAAQSKANLAERRPSDVREPRTAVQLCHQNAIFGGKVFLTEKQLLIHGSRLCMPGCVSTPSRSPLPHVTSAPVVASRITEDNPHGHRSSLRGLAA